MRKSKIQFITYSIITFEFILTFIGVYFIPMSATLVGEFYGDGYPWLLFYPNFYLLFIPNVIFLLDWLRKMSVSQAPREFNMLLHLSCLLCMIYGFFFTVRHFSITITGT